jgi:diguanylate cyclase (GGDEF)-like protein
VTPTGSPISVRVDVAVADAVLVHVADIIRSTLSGSDVAARYGGDEFALILPETDLEGARRSIARVRERILSGEFGEIQPQDRPRLSAGIVTFPHPSAVQTEDLFALVEAALLRGKAQTEDRIGTAESVAA